MGMGKTNTLRWHPPSKIPRNRADGAPCTLLVLLKYPWGPVPEYHVGFYDDGPQRWVAGKGVLNDDSMVLAWSYLPEEHKLVGV